MEGGDTTNNGVELGRRREARVGEEETLGCGVDEEDEEKGDGVVDEATEKKVGEGGVEEAEEGEAGALDEEGKLIRGKEEGEEGVNSLKKGESAEEGDRKLENEGDGGRRELEMRRGPSLAGEERGRAVLGVAGKTLGREEGELELKSETK